MSNLCNLFVEANAEISDTCVQLITEVCNSFAKPSAEMSVTCVQVRSKVCNLLEEANAESPLPMVLMFNFGENQKLCSYYLQMLY